MKFFAILMAYAFAATGLAADAGESFDRVCPDPLSTWEEPAESDFASYDRYFGFLNRRAAWARTVEQGTDLSYFEWLFSRYDWNTVTFADREYACYSHARTNSQRG